MNDQGLWTYDSEENKFLMLHEVTLFLFHFQIIVCPQFDSDIQIVRQFKETLQNFENKKVYCVKSGMLVEIDWNENISKNMKMRASKQIDGNKVLKMSKSQEIMVAYCGDQSLCLFNISLKNPGI